MTTSDSSSSFKVGLTGGIASGKSTVAENFRDLGVAIIDTDVIAREVVEPGQPAMAEIRHAFGDSVFTAAGELDRAAMRQLIFADASKRLALEGILHPRIGTETRRQSAAAPGAYQIVVVPLLVSSPLRDYVDRILVVDCDEETQIERLLDRDAESREQAEKILKAQASRDERLAIADDVIVNDAGLEKLEQEVAKLHLAYLELAAP